MPMLRKISLDLCDARDGDYDIPDVSCKRIIFFCASHIAQVYWQEIRYCSYTIMYAPWVI